MKDVESLVAAKNRLIQEGDALRDQARKKWQDAAILEGRIIKAYIDASLFFEAKANIISMVSLMCCAKLVDNNFTTMITLTVRRGGNEDVSWCYDQMAGVLKEKT